MCNLFWLHLSDRWSQSCFISQVASYGQGCWAMVWQLATVSCKTKMDGKQNSADVDLLKKKWFKITFFPYSKKLGCSSFLSSLKWLLLHDSHNFAPDVGPMTASIYSIQVLFSPSLLAQYNLRTWDDMRTGLVRKSSPKQSPPAFSLMV